MMKPPIIILALFVALIFAGLVHLHSVNIHPKSATGIVGGDVQINCEVEFGPNYEMSWDFNNAFLYIITHDIEDYPLGTIKYSVHKTGMNFALSVKDLSLEDGGEYMCTSYKSEATSFLVVLDTPSITLNPPAPLEGDTTKVTCEARFGGPKKYMILPGHRPVLKMYLNESSPNEIVTANDTSDVKKYYSISMTKNLKVHASMNKRHVTCAIETAEPLINTSDVAVLNVQYSVRDIHITPNQERYKVGDTITCIADSNPVAVYEWKKVQGGSAIYGNRLKITDDMNGENNWECFARNLINGEWFEERKQNYFVAEGPSKSENDRYSVNIATMKGVIIILVIFAAVTFIFRKKLLKRLKRSSTYGYADILQDLRLVKAENVLANYLQGLGLVEAEHLLVVQHGSEDSPLKYLLQLMDDEESFEKLFQDQKQLLSVIQKISSHGDAQYRTQCLRFITFTWTFSDNEYTFEWSEEYLSTLKELLENGADPTWISPEELKKERKKRSTAQTAFFFYIFVNLWEKNDLHESVLRVLPLMLSWKCKDNELLRATLLHAFVQARWDYIATNRELMPPDFFHQFQNILREILIHDGTLLVQKNWFGRTPLQSFLIDIKLEERIFGEVREIIQMLQTQEVLSSQNNSGQTPLHSLAFYFPVIQGEVSQSGRESFLDLVKSFANESNVGCQKENGLTALHDLARKFPGGIPEESREVYQDFVKHLATCDILEIKSIGGFTALHDLAKRFTFEIEEWAMETFVEVLKCLAVPRTICIKNKNGETALEIINKKWGNKVPEHYKDKYEEISDILTLSENN